MPRSLIRSIRSACAGFCVVFLLAGCSTAVPTPSLPTEPVATSSAVAQPTATSANDEEAIQQLILAEAEGVVAKDIDRLMSLWLPEGRVVDALHTPDNASDDLVWKGEYAIRDRYITLVFPGNPSTAAPADVQIAIQGDHAEVTSTTHIGEETSPAGDRWTFSRMPEGWRIESLIYNLEAK